MTLLTRLLLPIVGRDGNCRSILLSSFLFPLKATVVLPRSLLRDGLGAEMVDESSRARYSAGSSLSSKLHDTRTGSSDLSSPLVA